MKNNTAQPDIIDDTSLKTPLRRGIELSVTTAAWLLWVYLVMPGVTLALWAIGIRLFVLEQIKLNNYQGLLSVAGYYLAGLAGIWLALNFWSTYNKSRFGGLDRRRDAGAVTIDELVKCGGLTEADLVRAREARRVVFDFSATTPVLRDTRP